jgi:hypothetical protein
MHITPPLGQKRISALADNLAGGFYSRKLNVSRKADKLSVIVAKPEILNANFAKMAKSANIFTKFALFALFALSFTLNCFPYQAALLQPQQIKRD